MPQTGRRSRSGLTSGSGTAEGSAGSVVLAMERIANGQGGYLDWRGREAPGEVYDMEEEKWYGILWQFLWQRRRTAALLAAFAGIYAVVFYLYDMETEADRKSVV